MARGKYLKFFIIALAVAIIVPQVVLAAWWNPMSWNWNSLLNFFNSKPMQVQQQAPQVQQQNTVPTVTQDKNILSDVYPLFSNLKWGNAVADTENYPVGKTSGYKITAIGQINANQDAQKFFSYYDSKLKSAGWAQDGSFAADGILGSQIGYKKDNNYIVLDYNIKPGKVTSKKDEPMQYTCPCKVAYSIFTGSFTTPIVGNDRDSHGCIGSAGYSWCEIKQKCLRSWEEKCGL